MKHCEMNATNTRLDIKANGAVFALCTLYGIFFLFKHKMKLLFHLCVDTVYHRSAKPIYFVFKLYHFEQYHWREIHHVFKAIKENKPFSAVDCFFFRLALCCTTVGTFA